MSLVITAIIEIVKTVLSLNNRQQAYLRWRSSDDGRKHFDKQNEHDFWHAVVSGDTDVIDTGVKDKQKQIRDLKRELGLVLVLGLTLLAGCKHVLIPQPLPEVIPEQLKTSERTYVMTDPRVRTLQGTQELSGKWHVVNPDFIRTHVENQDDLISVLKLVKKERRTRRLERVLWVAGLLTTAFLFGNRRFQG